MDTYPKYARQHSTAGGIRSILPRVALMLWLLPAAAYTSLAQEDTLGTLIDAGTFTLRVPDIGDWTVEVDKEAELVILHREKQKLLSLIVPAGGATVLEVAKFQLGGDVPGIWNATEREVANLTALTDLRMIVRASTPEYLMLSESVMDPVTVEGKKCYPVHWVASMGNLECKSVSYLYFPPEYSRAKEYFLFLINDLTNRSIFSTEALDKLNPLIRSLRTSGSASTLPGVGGDLLRAAAEGDSSLVTHLIEGGANVNGLPEKGRGPLALAALHGREAIVRYLVDHGAEVNPAGVPELFLPLTSAILGREIGVARYLLEKGAAPNTPSDSEWSPLRRAIAMDLDTAFVSTLLDHGADPNLWREWSPLMQAAMEGQSEIVDLLIARGAVVDARNSSGWDPLMRALMHGRAGIANVLLTMGASPTAPMMGGDTPLGLASTIDDTALILRLIGMGADVNAVNKRGISPLHAAVDRGNTNCARILLAHGAVVDARIEDGRTPLYISIQEHQIDCARLLLDKGADVNGTGGGGWTSLMAAAKRGDSVAVVLLISRGAKLDIENEKGDTASDIADEYEQEAIVEMLEKAEERR